MKPLQQDNLVIDKDYLRRVIDQQNAAINFTPDENATAEMALEMCIALGIRPEDNTGSYGIVSARDEY